MHPSTLVLSVCLVSLLASGGLQAQNPTSPPATASPPPTTPNVRFTGYLQARETYRDGVGLTGSLNRARLAAFGSAAKDLTWRIQGEFRTGSVGTG